MKHPMLLDLNSESFNIVAVCTIRPHHQANAKYLRKRLNGKYNTILVLLSIPISVLRRHPSLVGWGKVLSPNPKTTGSEGESKEKFRV